MENQLPELTVSAAKHNIEIICIQERWYNHSELQGAEAKFGIIFKMFF